MIYINFFKQFVLACALKNQNAVLTLMRQNDLSCLHHLYDFLMFIWLEQTTLPAKRSINQEICRYLMCIEVSYCGISHR